MDLNEKTCMVFGAGRGIGRRVAGLFSNAGANIVVSSRTESDLHELEFQLNAEGNPNVLSVAADAADLARRLRIRRKPGRSPVIALFTGAGAEIRCIKEYL